MTENSFKVQVKHLCIEAEPFIFGDTTVAIFVKSVEEFVYFGFLRFVQVSVFHKPITLTH